MIRCPGCSYFVPPAWESCKRCGRPLGAQAKAPVAAGVRTGAGAAAGAPPIRAPSIAGPPAAPIVRPAPPEVAPLPPETDVLLPAGTDVPSPAASAAPGELLPVYLPAERVSRSGRPSLGRRRSFDRKDRFRFVPLIVAGAVVVAGAYAVWPRGSAPKPPEVLAPADEPGGFASSIGAATRAQAEAARHQAVVAVSYVAERDGGLAFVTPSAVASQTPGLEWIEGNSESDGYDEVSLYASAQSVDLAVAGTGDICAFARLPADGLVEYVTIRRPQSCRAVDAPAKGWSTNPGAGPGITPEAF